MTHLGIALALLRLDYQKPYLEDFGYTSLLPDLKAGIVSRIDPGFSKLVYNRAGRRPWNQGLWQQQSCESLLEHGSKKIPMSYDKQSILPLSKRGALRPEVI